MKKIILIFIYFLITTNLIIAENFFCVDEIRTGLVKEKESWSSKEIKYFTGDSAYL